MGPDSALHFTLATAGHVDHGKTSLLRALTGIDPDRLKEEKEREMTIDLGFANFRISGADMAAMDEKMANRFKELIAGEGNSVDPAHAELVIGFVDVPGHGKFLKNMLAGVGGIDLALLVVAADEGVMPQTIQHVKILTLLGVRDCILVLNKTDLADDETREIALLETQDLLSRLGVNALDVVSVSCGNGSGIDELKKTIVKHVLNLPQRDRKHDALGKSLASYLAIDRVFSKAGYGAVVTGTLTKGSITVGDEVFIEPNSNSARVRGLQTFSHKLERAFPGQRLAINLALKDNKPIERGQAVLGVKTAPVRTLIVQLTDLGGLETLKNFDKLPRGAVEPGAEEVLKPQAIRFYHGTAERYGHLRWCEKLASDQYVIGQLFLTDAVIAAPGERFVIRYGDYGIAGGEILMTARPRWLSRAMLQSLAHKILAGGLDEAAHELINLSPQRSLEQNFLSALLPEHVRNRIVSELLASGKVEKVGDQLITRDEKEELVKRILGELQKSAASGERDPSVSQEKLKVQVAPLVDRVVFQNIIKDLVSTNRIVKNDERISLATAAPARSASTELNPLMEKILGVLDAEFCIEIETIIERTGAKKKDVMDALGELEKSGRAAVVNYEFAAGSAAILKSHKVLASLWQKQRNIAPGDFREQVGTTRKYAMALLAYFDDHQITRRLNNGRVLLKTPPS